MALKALGWGLSAMTLGGLAVGLGVVIDDAVIGVENVLTNLRDAEAGHTSRIEAVLAASLEVRAPVIYATLAVVVVLAPILFLRGAEGALLRPLAGALMAASLASLMIGALVTPALCLLFLRHVGPQPDHPMTRRLKDRHARWLAWLCARPRAVLTVGAALAAVAIAALLLCHPALTPRISDGELVAETSAPASASLAVSREYGMRIAARLLQVRGVGSVTQRIGRDPSGDDSLGPERSVFHVALAPGLGPEAQGRIAGRVLQSFRNFPGLSPSVGTRFDSILGSGPTAAPVEISVFGQDLDALDAAARRIASVARALPGAGDVRVDDPGRAPVMRADIDFQRLALFGLSSADILATVRAAFEGETVAQIYDGSRVVDLAVSAQESLRRDPEGVGDLLLRSTSGIAVPLRTVANGYLTDDRDVIAHDGGLRRQIVTASPADPVAFIRQARQAIAQRVALPPGAFVEFGGRAGEGGASGEGLILDYVLALFVIFGLLAVAFDGRTGALILASTLFSLVGAAVALGLLGGVLSLGAIMGFIALFGLSMRGAMLLFGEVEERVLSRREHWSPELVVRAARERVTPLLTTALLVALAVAPLAVHAGDAGREILGPMAIVILGGLATSTLAALFVLPAMILVLWRPAWARRARHRGPPTEQA